MPEPVLAATVRLTSAAEALAALAAHIRVRSENVAVDPAIARLLAAIATELTGSPDVTPAEHGAQALGMARSLLREAVAMIDDPSRQGDWSATDPAVLQGIGRLSMAIAPVFDVASRQLPGLADVLRSDSARFLDVGTGTAWLAIATARTFPSVRVVGIDLFEPALQLANANVAAEGLSERVEVRRLDVVDLDEHEAYDAVWLPLPFLPKAVVPAAIERVHRALRPGGWLLPGTFAGPDERVAQLLTELRIRRSGGHPWSAAELDALLTAGGFVDVQEVARIWAAPVQLFAARRPLRSVS